jgi:hypothetical protein
MEDGFIADSVRDATWYAWQVLNIHTADGLKVPDACPGPNGEVALSWDDGSKHFEVEVDRQARVTCFYQDLELKNAWEVPTDPHGQMDERIKTALGIFTLAKPVPTSPATSSWF